MTNEIMVIRITKEKGIEAEQYSSTKPYPKAITIIFDDEYELPDIPTVEQREVTVEGLRVRSTPNIATNIVDSLSNGDKVTVYERVRGVLYTWIRIHPEKQRWIAEKYTREI